MLVKPLLSHILEDDALTRGLGDSEARVLVEWLVDQTEQLSAHVANESAAWSHVKRLCRRARAIARFVILWCYQGERGAAVQLAAAERFTWSFPNHRFVDPCELMHQILTSEAKESYLPGGAAFLAGAGAAPFPPASSKAT
jgi:hypothetical protein